MFRDILASPALQSFIRPLAGLGAGDTNPEASRCHGTTFFCSGLSHLIQGTSLAQTKYGGTEKNPGPWVSGTEEASPEDDRGGHLARGSSGQTKEPPIAGQRRGNQGRMWTTIPSRLCVRLPIPPLQLTALDVPIAARQRPSPGVLFYFFSPGTEINLLITHLQRQAVGCPGGETDFFEVETRMQTIGETSS